MNLQYFMSHHINALVPKTEIFLVLFVFLETEVISILGLIYFGNNACCRLPCGIPSWQTVIQYSVYNPQSAR